MKQGNKVKQSPTNIPVVGKEEVAMHEGHDMIQKSKLKQITIMSTNMNPSNPREEKSYKIEKQNQKVVNRNDFSSHLNNKQLGFLIFK